MIRAFKFAQTVRFTTSGAIRSEAGTIAVTAGSAAVAGTLTLFTTDAISSRYLYTPDLRFIGIMDAAGDETTAILISNSPITYSGAYVTTAAALSFRDFEIRDGVIGFDEKRRDFELVNGDIEKYLEHYRFVLGIQSPYIRRAGSGSYDFADVLRDIDAGSTVNVTIPALQIPAYHIVKVTSGISQRISRQHFKPSLDYVFQAVKVESTLPTWFNFTKDSPGYLL